MSVVQVAGALAAKTALAAGLNALGTWGTRLISWHSQAIVPGAISAAIYTTFEFTAIKAQQALCSDTPQHHALPRGYQVHQVERIRKVSAAIGAIATVILTPHVSKRLGYDTSFRASIAFTLPSLLLSYLTPASRRRGF